MSICNIISIKVKYCMFVYFQILIDNGSETFMISSWPLINKITLMFSSLLLYSPNCKDILYIPKIKLYSRNYSYIHAQDYWRLFNPFEMTVPCPFINYLHFFKADILKIALGFWLEMWPSKVHEGPSGRGHEKYTEIGKKIIIWSLTYIAMGEGRYRRMIMKIQNLSGFKLKPRGKKLKVSHPWKKVV